MPLLILAFLFLAGCHPALFHVEPAPVTAPAVSADRARWEQEITAAVNELRAAQVRCPCPCPAKGE